MENHQASRRAQEEHSGIPFRFFGCRHASAIGVALLVLAVTSGLLGCPQAGQVGTNTCLACHDGRSAPDQRDWLDGAHAASYCEFCHGPGQSHVRSGAGSALAIQNPARWAFDDAVGLCARCHGAIADNFRKTRHALGRAVVCHDCHNVHSASGFSGGKQAGRQVYTDLCRGCHTQQHDGFFSSRHRAFGGGQTCAMCHNIHAETRLTAPSEDNSLCLQCHASPLLGFDSEEAIDLHTGDFHPVTPEENGASRCTGCHLPTLPTRRWDRASSSHTFVTIPPSATNDAIAAGANPPPPNSCSGVIGCHDPDVPGSGVPHDPADIGQNEAFQPLYDLTGGLPG